MIKIRRFQNKDKEQIILLIEKILIEIFGNKVNHRRYMQDLGNIKNNYILFYVAEDKDKIVGTIALEKRDKNYWLKRMYLEKNYRGTGLSKKMYEKIEQFLIKNKIPKIFLSTTIKMKSAQKFYLKLGFKKIKEDKKSGSIFFAKELK